MHSQAMLLLRPIKLAQKSVQTSEYSKSLHQARCLKKRMCGTCDCVCVRKESTKTIVSAMNATAKSQISMEVKTECSKFLAIRFSPNIQK